MAILMIISMVSFESTQAQKTVFSLGPGMAFSAPANLLSTKFPTAKVEINYFPTNMWSFGLRMRPLGQYSPAKDTFGVKFTNMANLYLITGIQTTTAEKGFNCGVSTGFGLAFAEDSKDINTYPTWDCSIKGGYCINKTHAIFVDLNYSYVWTYGGAIHTNGFSFMTEITWEITIPNSSPY
ncbi:MAG: hypothetical protein WDK96_03870 [Candidatus Paceibacterota bacterium]